MLYSLNQTGFLDRPLFIADREVLTLNEVLNVMAEAIGAKKSLELPDFIGQGLCRLPLLGKRFRILTKDRVYSIKRLTDLGFKHLYPARDSLRKSCQLMFDKIQ